MKAFVNLLFVCSIIGSMAVAFGQTFYFDSEGNQVEVGSLEPGVIYGVPKLDPETIIEEVFVEVVVPAKSVIPYPAIIDPADLQTYANACRDHRDNIDSNAAFQVVIVGDKGFISCMSQMVPRDHEFDASSSFMLPVKWGDMFPEIIETESVSSPSGFN